MLRRHGPSQPDLVLTGNTMPESQPSNVSNFEVLRTKELGDLRQLEIT